MTVLVECNTTKQKILDALGIVKDDSIKTITVKVGRGKQIVDAGDCFIIKCDQKTNK